MVYPEKLAGVVTPFDAQKLFVVRATELLFPVWCEEITFVHEVPTPGVAVRIRAMARFTSC